jgi:hypothetical protein
VSAGGWWRRERTRAGEGSMFRVSGSLLRGWPPPPHDPRERVPVSRARGWDVRSFLLEDRRFAYFAPRSLWHMQLWHAGAGVSVLTPSRLTRGRYEIVGVGGARSWARGHRDLRWLLQNTHDIEFLSEAMLLALEAHFVHDPVERFLADAMNDGAALAARGAKSS